MPTATVAARHAPLAERSFREVLLDELVAAPRDGPAAATPAASPRGAVVPPVVRALDHEDPWVVAFAAGLLARTDDALAVPQLARLLGHPHERVVATALQGLELQRGALTPAACLSALGRAPWLLRTAGTLFGAATPSATSEALHGLLEDAALAPMVAAAMARAPAREILPLLVAVLHQQPTPPVVATCLRTVGAALERQRRPRELRGLERWVRAVAARVPEPRLQAAFGAAPPEPGPPDPKRTLAAVVRGIARDPLFAALLLAGWDPALQQPLAACPVTLAREQLPAIDAGLVSPCPGVRLLACRCVAALDAVDSAPWVEELVRDDDAAVRAAAIHTLARFRHAVAVPALVQRLHDPSALVRDAAVLALGRLDAELVSIALLCETLADGALRLPALRIMRLNPHPAQLRFVESCLRDRRARVRCAAVLALERQPEADRFTRLRPLLADPADAVRDAAATALARSGDARARELLVAEMQRAARPREGGAAPLVEAVAGPPHAMAAPRRPES
jgi:HEAT repeat protein